MTKTEEEPATFEKVWAAMKEMSREADLRRKEADQRSKEADLRQEAAARTMEDLKQTVKAVSRQLGGMANSDGDAAEEHFATSLASKMTFGGQHYDAIDFKVKRKTRDIEGEFDIVLYNGTAVAIIEVKNKASKEDVEELVAKKLPAFRALFPLYKNHAVYLGIGSMSFADDRVLTKARDLGIGILRQKGDTIESVTSPIRPY